MRKYLAFFITRFNMGLQYRVAALAGLACQFFWGAMAILAFKAFYDTDPASFPMALPAMSSYIWLQQALLTLLTMGGIDNEFFNVIENGNVAYELCRPVDVYAMWYSRSAATRVSNALLRCIPVLIVAALIPAPYGLMAPPDLLTFLTFLLSLLLALAVINSMGMIVYMITFHTITPRGVRLIAVNICDFFSGDIIPLPFFPAGFKDFVELLPFSATANVPLRIYSGDLHGPEMVKLLLLQAFWAVVLIAVGKVIEQRELRRVTIQGG